MDSMPAMEPTFKILPERCRAEQWQGRCQSSQVHYSNGVSVQDLAGALRGGAWQGERVTSAMYSDKVTLKVMPLRESQGKQAAFTGE